MFFRNAGKLLSDYGTSHPVHLRVSHVRVTSTGPAFVPLLATVETKREIQLQNKRLLNNIVGILKNYKENHYI
jgi:hypothetical protein